MPEVSIDLNMVRITNDDFVKKAEACAPKLQETIVKPVSIVDIVKTENIYPDVVVKDSVENLSSHHLGKGDKLCLDFGDHQVGYVTCVSVSSVNMDQVKPIKSDDEMIRTLDKVSLRTLMNCMQSVFEDGPKRDRRLWLGDLRLQALANYDTFKNYDLVKRCLYLFAGQTRDDGMVSACLFTEPKFIVDDTFLLDYSMFYGAALLDYYKASGDMETLRDLSKCAYRQMELAGKQFDEKDLLICGEGFWEFIDWTDGLDKQAAMQGVYIYCAKKVREIAEILGDTEKAAELAKEEKAKTEAAKKYLLDSEAGLFVSGPNRQINYASQVWMVLAGAVGKEDGAQILEKVIDMKPEKGMVSPYMNHHYVEALLLCGKKEQALGYMKYYWGGMISHGADTFWELYNPENPAESPYGSSIVNSYCHAWSCTPTYLLRKYFA